MPNKFQRREIGKEIFLSSVTDPRFKHNVISVNFSVPLSKETASEYALVARILNKSCAKYPTFAQLNNKLSALYAARIDSSVGSFGDFQALSVSVQYIDNKYALENEKVEEEATDIFLECLLNPLTENGVFSEKTTLLERQILIDDIESEINDKQTYANHRAGGIMYEGEPAAVNGLGSVEQAKRVTPLTAFNAYKRLLKHARIEIICAGCSDFKAAEKTLSRAFSQVERDEIFKCMTLKSPLKDKPRHVTEKMQVAQSKMVLGFKTDCDNYPALQIMSALYGGTATSKLFVNVREKMSLCYYCWSGVNKNKGSLSVKCGVENENIEKASAEIITQLDAVKNGDFTDEDTEHAKMYRKNGLQTYNDSFAQMALWYLLCIYDDDIKTPEEAVREGEAVTREDIIEAAKSVKLDTVYVLTSVGEEAGKEAQQ